MLLRFQREVFGDSWVSGFFNTRIHAASVARVSVCLDPLAQLDPVVVSAASVCLLALATGSPVSVLCSLTRVFLMGQGSCAIGLNDRFHLLPICLKPAQVTVFFPSKSLRVVRTCSHLVPAVVASPRPLPSGVLSDSCNL